LTVNDVRSKWNHLCVQFMRELRGIKKKSGSGGGGITSKWKFFALLTFLQPKMKNTVSRMSTLVRAAHCSAAALIYTVMKWRIIKSKFVRDIRDIFGGVCTYTLIVLHVVKTF